MNRKLLMIASDGGGENALKGVHYDKENYLRFFMSPEGGAWQKNNEIIVYDDNNFYLDSLRQIIINANAARKPIDYFLIVYCGHGFTDQYGNTYFQIRPDCNLKVEDLQVTVKDSRCLLIADSCRAICRLKEGGGITSNPYLFSTINEGVQRTYAELCREMYDSHIAETPSNEYITYFSNSFGETAEENGNGGVYSYQLLSTAKEYISEFGSKQQYTGKSDWASIDSCHKRAKNRVIINTYGTQHPEVYQDTPSAAQFPFVVVPNYQLQLPDEDFML